MCARSSVGCKAELWGEDMEETGVLISGRWARLYWDYDGVIYIGIMEKNMENTGITGVIAYILGLYWDNGKENGNYYSNFLHCAAKFDAGKGIF